MEASIASRRKNGQLWMCNIIPSLSLHYVPHCECCKVRIHITTENILCSTLFSLADMITERV